MQVTSEELGLILFGSLTKQSHQDLNFEPRSPLPLAKTITAQSALSPPGLPYEVVAVLNHMYMSDVTRDKVNQRHTAVSNDCLWEMKLLLLAAFNTLCKLGSSLNN